MTARAFFLATILAGSAACAAKSADTEGTTAPQLIGCGAYIAPHPSVVRYRVAVDFVVGADGHVREGSAIPRPGRRRTQDETWVERARRDAYSCMYEPARSGTRAVESRASILFSYSG